MSHLTPTITTDEETGLPTYVITFDKEYQYITEDLLPDLPDNAYIHKGCTGVGGTTLVLTNPVSYVITVPMKNLIDNKLSQETDKNRVLGVTGDTSKEEILQYVASLKPNQPVKIMVTFDSLDKVTDAIDVSECKLLVDEAQTLIQYGGTFKPEVCNKVLRKGYKFKSVSYITATPTKRKYLPEELKKLDYYYFDWKGSSKPEIETIHVQRCIKDKIALIVYDKIKNSTDDVFIFYNSVVGVTSSIDTILKVLPEYSIDDINIMFSDSTTNNKAFKKAFKNIDLKYQPNKRKRINFLSSMAFQGIDIYTDNDVFTLIVSEARKRSMRYDIHTDLPQIVGRFRANKETGIRPKNEICFMWSEYDETMNMSEENYENRVIDHIKMYEGFLEQSKEKSALKTPLNDSYIGRMPIVICKNPDEKDIAEREFYINEFAYSSMMSVYSSMFQDFTTFNNIDENNNIRGNSIIHSKIADCFSITDTYEFPFMNSIVSVALDKNPSFTRTAKTVHKIMTEIEDVYDYDKIFELKALLKDELDSDDDLRKYVEVLGWNRLSSLSYSKPALEKDYQEKYIFVEKKVDIQEFMNLEIGSIYSRDVLLLLVKNTFEKFSVNLEPKVSFLSNFYENKTSSMKVDGKVVNAIKILSLK